MASSLAVGGEAAGTALDSSIAEVVDRVRSLRRMRPQRPWNINRKQGRAAGTAVALCPLRGEQVAGAAGFARAEDCCAPCRFQSRPQYYIGGCNV